jgi:hypothetical protein
MQLITDHATYYHDLFRMCRSVHQSVAVDHLSEAQWLSVQSQPVSADNVLIAQPCLNRLNAAEENLKNAFAVIGTVCQNNTQSIQWIPVTRNDFVLWLRELSPMTTEATIIEDVVVQSAHVRLAQFRVPTKCRLIPKLRDRLLRGLRDYHVVEGSRENHFCMALEEALNNAFYHGNLEISSELKEDGSSRYIELAAERELLAPWCHRSVYVTELASEFGVWITIRDDGGGFNVQAALDRCNDPEALLASGRGLLLMRGFSDEVFFNTAGNEVTLVLYADGQNRELPLTTQHIAGAEPRLVTIN